MMYVEADRTSITAKNMNKICEDIWTTDEILHFLYNEEVYRTFSETLSRICSDDDLEKKLTENMCRITGKDAALMSKNVKNWMYHDMIPQRKQLFQICYALGLNEKEADALITSASETGIHYRNPKEIIYAYGLTQGKSWEETMTLCANLLPMCLQKMKNLENDDQAYSVAYKVSTNAIKNHFFTHVNSDEELESFLAEHAPLLGELHLSAYKDFMDMMDILRWPEENAHKYSVRKIVAEYLKMGVPNHTSKRKNISSTEKRANDYTPLQRVILKNWPSDDIIIKMIHRHIDVSRKVMLLLFLVTEEFEARNSSRLQKKTKSRREDRYLEEKMAELDYFEVEEILEMRINQINLFLDYYGMNRLDPRNVFDCLVLYALKAGLDGVNADYMDKRMERILREIFVDV